MPVVLHVVGARPNFPKVAPLVAALARCGIPQRLVHTGQHFDERMSGIFFEELGIPRPDEAGLRSFDRSMPEEVNRVVTDHLSDLLLTPSPDADENLRREGIEGARVACVGNLMVDTLRAHLSRARALGVPAAMGLEPRRYAAATLHRPSNVDDPAALGRILAALARIADEVPVIFPAHPRTRARLADPFAARAAAALRVVEPLGYLELLSLTSAAGVVLTDSGGLQEEATALGVPCLTLRDRTERPITVSEGTNEVVGTEQHRIVAAALRALSDPRPPRCPALWDGHAADRAAEAVASFLEPR